MIIRKTADQIVAQSPTCGEIRELLLGDAYPFLNIAVAQDIRPTRAHFHKGFDEIYFVLDGRLRLRFYEPDADRTWELELGGNELCVIPKGVHHVVVESSEANRLCVITVPGFDPADEHLSDRL
jgi:mannose-6-phosphate isomerase-like protein (cupin superfamily)